MSSKTLINVYRTFRVLIVLLVTVCLASEITQIVSFSHEHPDRNTSDFFAEGWYKTQGIKPYCWTVIFIGLIISVYHVIISFGRFESEIQQSDHIVDFGLAMLWLSAALSYIYPAYVGFIIVCKTEDPVGNKYTDSLIGWCHGYVTSLAFSWIISIIYSVMAIISRRLWKQTGREIEFESNTTYVPRSELDEFLSPPPSLGFTENRRNSNPNRGMNFNPGSSGSNSFTHTQNISNPRFETHHAARIPNINPYYGNNSNNN